MLESVVVKLSLKEQSYRVLSMLDFLKYFGTKCIYLVHVSSEHKGKKHQKNLEQLKEIADNARELGFEVEIYIKSGNAPASVIALSKELKADYICLFWKKKGAFKQALLGSIDSDILRQTDIPVFIYRPCLYLEKKAVLDKILYATDFKATDSKIMPYFVNRALTGKTLYLLHVGTRAPDPYTEKERKDQAESNLKRLASEADPAFEQVENLEVVGPIKNKIIMQAWKYNVDLIVIGKSDKATPLGQIMGSIAESLPHKTNCNLLIIPGVVK